MSSTIVGTTGEGSNCDTITPAFGSKNFPSRLYEFLNIVEDMEISHIASWQPHGRSFRVHNPEDFVKITNPSWFVYTKYSSFQRQLNIYGFQRVTKGIDKNSYYHKWFRRGNSNLLQKIRRVPLKNDCPYKPSTTSPVPDFYDLSALNESNTPTVSLNQQQSRWPESVSSNRERQVENQQESSMSLNIASITKQTPQDVEIIDTRPNLYRNRRSSCELVPNVSTLLGHSHHSEHIEALLTQLQSEQYLQSRSLIHDPSLRLLDHPFDHSSLAINGVDAMTTLQLQNHPQPISSMPSLVGHPTSIQSQHQQELYGSLTSSLSAMNQSIRAPTESRRYTSQDIQTLLGTPNVSQMLQRENQIRAIQSAIDTGTASSALALASFTGVDAVNGGYNLIQHPMNSFGSNDDQIRSHHNYLPPQSTLPSLDSSVHLGQSLSSLGRPSIVNYNNQIEGLIRDPNLTLLQSLVDTDRNSVAAAATVASPSNEIPITSIVDALILRNQFLRQF